MVHIGHMMTSLVHEDRHCKFALAFEAGQIFLMKGKRGQREKYAWKASQKGVFLCWVGLYSSEI